MEQVKSISNTGTKLQAAIELGRLGGLSKSLKKQEASRRNGSAPCKNGKQRGRPKGSKNKVK